MSEMEVYTYPVQNECMRWSNGTQVKLQEINFCHASEAFRVDPMALNVTQALKTPAA